MFNKPALLASVAIVLAAASSANAANVYAVTTDNVLVRFDTASPGSVTTIGAITGLGAGETIMGIDFRPATGQLYGLGSGSRLYTINAAAAATQVGSDGAFVLAGTSFGFDFNPTVDRIRVVSNADQNLRLNPNNGALAATDTPLAYDNTTADGDPIDPNAGADPNVVGAAYLNNFAGATTTILYDIDSSLDILAIQNPPNGGVLNTVGSLGVNIDDLVGFDIEPVTNNAFASFHNTQSSLSSFYSINLGTGAATLIGEINARGPIGALSIQGIPLPSAASAGLLLLGGLATARRRAR